jgi:hypothetical protein
MFFQGEENLNTQEYLKMSSHPSKFSSSAPFLALFILSVDEQEKCTNSLASGMKMNNCSRGTGNAIDPFQI